MKIQISENISIELVENRHAPGIFSLVESDRDYLRTWLPWVDYANSVEFIENFVKGSQQRNSDGVEHGFVILEKDKVIGRIGVYEIDSQNRIGEIGYWIGKDYQGRGIVTDCCRKMVDFCFNELNLNRIEIKCGSENFKSQFIPERLNFKLEGVIRQGELVHGKFIDLNLYALLKDKR
jgi:ribosomal-protein-serine acetyltransferase